MKQNVDVMELVEIIEPEACKEAKRCADQGITPDFDTNIKIIRAMTFARKALNFIYSGKE